MYKTDQFMYIDKKKLGNKFQILEKRYIQTKFALYILLV